MKKISAFTACDDDGCGDRRRFSISSNCVVQFHYYEYRIRFYPYGYELPQPEGL